MKSLFGKWFSMLFVSWVSPSLMAETQQTTDTLLMISPDSFQYNFQTAQSNYFQQFANSPVTKNALEEFKQMVKVLKENQINVIVIPSRKDEPTPDAVFPNNWFSVHKLDNNKIILILYPLLATNRRAERQVNVLKAALKAKGIQISTVLDLTHYEKQHKALESTGSLVLDRVHRIAFASLSPRTHEMVLKSFVDAMHYKPIVFHSYDKQGKIIYHTNVMMSVGTHFSIIAVDSITDPIERENVLAALRNAGKNIVAVTVKQMEKMAANILEVRSKNGDSKILLSQTAYDSLTPQQRQQLQHYGQLVVLPIPTIEEVGGGSVRCMLAEIFY